MSINNQLKSLRLSQTSYPKLPDKYPSNPFDLFEQWLTDAIQKEIEGNTLVLSTQHDGTVDSRIVLLKAIHNESLFIESRTARRKVDQLRQHNQVAVNFYWPVTGRQVRIQGTASFEYPEQINDYLDASTRDDLTVVQIKPTRYEFYQSLTEGGFKRFEYTNPTDWTIHTL